MLRTAFKLPLRQTEGLLVSILTLMGLTNSAPDHTTVSRRAVNLPVIQSARAPNGPVHVLIDSTGLQVYGAGQWLEAKHGAKTRRKWRKLHLAVHAASCMIVAHTLADQDADDPSQVAPLLDQIDGPIIRVTADGAYDGAPTYQTIAMYGDGIEVVIPPRSTVVPNGEQGAPTQRDRNLAMITEHGRLTWQVATNYDQRSLIETTMGRYKCWSNPGREHVASLPNRPRLPSAWRSCTGCWRPDAPSVARVSSHDGPGPESSRTPSGGCTNAVAM
jgi:hypothetical protein